MNCPDNLKYYTIVTSVQETKRHLSMYVKNDMGINLPPKTDKRYYPRIRAILNHIFLRDKN